MRFKNFALMTLISIIWAAPLLADNVIPEFKLSPIELVESKDSIDHISQADMERKTASNLWDALKGVLGVYQQTNSGRNEGTISIRGSNRFQVGMYIDDIPIATAYRNEWDLNNVMLFDLESIEISKGYSSPLLTSNNNLSGTINLRTAKPVRELEFSAKYINFFDRKFDDQGRMFAASVGSKRELYYIKATVMQNEQDFFRLPDSFRAAPQEDGGRRNNSDYKNRGLNFIAGYTPSDDVDIMFGFVRQSFKKGQPFDAAQTYSKPPYPNAYPFARFWSWPEYESTRYYVNANIGLTDKAHLKAVAYYDGHKDTSIDYYTIDMQRRGYADKTYDQFTAGGHLTLDYIFNQAHKLALSAGYRQLSHKEYNDYGNFDDSGLPRNRKKKAAEIGKPMDEHIVEDYWDFGAEYTLKATDPLTLVFGMSYSIMNPKTLDSRDHVSGLMSSGYKDGLDASKDLFNYQMGAFYDITDKQQLFFTFAKKSRFATMRERYFRTRGVPSNPHLKPEHAFHYEIGYRALIADCLKINSSIYYSDIKDMITLQGPRGASYFVNLNKSDFFGFELGAEALINEYLSAGLTFNALEWNNKTNNTNLTGLPKLNSTVYAVISPMKELSIIPQINLSSGFYWSEQPNDAYSKSPGYATVDLKAVYELNENLSFELGARNIFDKEYALSAYYPEPGRNFFLGVSAKY